MLTAYIDAALREAQYEVMEDGRFFGSIPSCQGCWGEGATLEATRADLLDAVESWMMHRLRRGMALPVLAGVDLNGAEGERDSARAEGAHAEAR